MLEEAEIAVLEERLELLRGRRHGGAADLGERMGGGGAPASAAASPTMPRLGKGEEGDHAPASARLLAASPLVRSDDGGGGGGGGGEGEEPSPAPGRGPGALPTGAGVLSAPCAGFESQSGVSRTLPSRPRAFFRVTRRWHSAARS